jgi:hypothetical protein
MHDASKALMGSTSSSMKEVTNYPTTTALEAGLVAHLKSDETVTKAKADGQPVGVSLGKDLSDTGRTAVCRKGLGVPVKLKASFNPTIGAVVYIDDAEGYATGDGTKTAVNAVYASGRLGGSGATGGIAEGSSSDASPSVGVALIDFPGGL